MDTTAKGAKKNTSSNVIHLQYVEGIQCVDVDRDFISRIRQDFFFIFSQEKRTNGNIRNPVFLEKLFT